MPRRRKPTPEEKEVEKRKAFRNWIASQYLHWIARESSPRLYREFANSVFPGLLTPSETIEDFMAGLIPTDIEIIRKLEERMDTETYLAVFG
ncbi:MAG TPA: hypothetical protein PK530_20935 [Anaerolineales bacterium]|nr:hypothetical protein [Anaerolineales bacterium]